MACEPPLFAKQNITELKKNKVEFHTRKSENCCELR